MDAPPHLGATLFESQTMKPNLQPSEEQVEMFRRWAACGKELRRLSNVIDNFELPPLTAKTARDYLAAYLPHDFDIDTDDLLIQITSLRRIMEQNESNPAETVASLTEGLLSAGLDRTESSDWLNELAPSIETFLDSEFFRIFSKSTKLAYDYASVASDVRIVTDARPVYSKDLESLSGVIVSHVLRLDFQSSEQSQTISIALDHDDLMGLYLECERAIQKANTLVKCLGAGTVIKAAIAGG